MPLLEDLNAEFYESYASEFVARRTKPWVGWSRSLECLKQANVEVDSVLDLGCGHGRFATYLQKRIPLAKYVGVDQSRALLETARSCLPSRYHFVHHDLLQGIPVQRVPRSVCDLGEQSPYPLRALCHTNRFSLVCLWAIMHHIPGQSRREDLLIESAKLVGPDGALGMSLWHPQRSPRLKRRLVTPSDAKNHLPIRAKTESGDFLLPWGSAQDGKSPFRYCHAFDARESDSLIQCARRCGLLLAARFDADGNPPLNEYLIFRRV